MVWMVLPRPISSEKYQNFMQTVLKKLKFY